MKMEQIRFKSGTMLTFRATRSFALGGFGVQIANGEELLFDGSSVDYAGTHYSFPNLRGAITAGWIVLDDQYDETAPHSGKPVSANIQVRHPTEGGNPLAPDKKMSISTTESDERVVGNATTHAAATKASNVRTSSIGGIEAQDGVPVRTLKSPAVSKTSMTDVGAAIDAANKVQIDAGESVNTEESMLAAMSEEDREMYIAQKASRRQAYVEDPAEADRQVIAKIAAAKKTTTSEGITATSKVGGGVATADPVDPGDKAEETVHTEDGITMRNTNGPKNGDPQAARQAQTVEEFDEDTIDARRMIARQMCSDFPSSYDFKAPARKKLARLLADFEDRPDVILAVFAAESDAFKRTLRQEFPAAFAS